MNYILSRLSKPSTYAGIAAILTGAGVAVPPGVLQDVTFFGVVASGIVAVVLKEGWKQALSSGDAVKAVEIAVDTTKGN